MGTWRTRPWRWGLRSYWCASGFRLPSMLIADRIILAALCLCLESCLDSSRDVFRLCHTISDQNDIIINYADGMGGGTDFRLPITKCMPESDGCIRDPFPFAAAPPAVLSTNGGTWSIGGIEFRIRPIQRASRWEISTSVNGYMYRYTYDTEVGILRLERTSTDGTHSDSWDRCAGKLRFQDLARIANRSEFRL